ncbi:bacitracin ABC transporter ATP-binding protein [Clostridioides difficile]|nr:bacitracin ABC transporter ATP-binding protein [Clostridioides difficile]
MKKMIIEVSNLSKVVDLLNTELTILKNIDLYIEEGEFVSIMGASGSGKSSLISILSGLDKNYTGDVNVCGENLSKLTDDELAEYRNRKIGIVFQSFNLITSMSVEENIKLPLIFSDNKEYKIVDKMIQKVGLTSKIKNNIKQLSGGEKQRVAIARALVCTPNILFADEPTGSLDSTNSHAIMQLFKNINNEYGTTIVMVTHDLQMAEYSDRIISIKDGTIIK